MVLTDLPARWRVLRVYQRRFWIEPGFRSDKRKGWQWEERQVRGVARHARLLLALAWASLVALCLGAQAAEARLGARRRGGAAPPPAGARARQPVHLGAAPGAAVALPPAHRGAAMALAHPPGGELDRPVATRPGFFAHFSTVRP